MSKILGIRPATKVVVTAPALTDLTMRERFNLLRPYVAYGLYALALVVAARLVWQLVQQYRAEHAVVRRSRVADRKTLLNKKKE